MNSPFSLLTLQVAGIVAGMAGLAFAPPAQGRMLLVPLNGAAAERLVPMALDRGGLLLGTGPLPHSYIVYGSRARLMGSMARAGIVALSAPPAGCGDAERAG